MLYVNYTSNKKNEISSAKYPSLLLTSSPLTKHQSTTSQVLCHFITRLLSNNLFLFHVCVLTGGPFNAHIPTTVSSRSSGLFLTGSSRRFSPCPHPVPKTLPRFGVFVCYIRTCAPWYQIWSSQSSSEKQKPWDVHTLRGRLREPAHGIMEAGKSSLQVEPTAPAGRAPSCSGEAGLSVLSTPSTGWTRPTHTHTSTATCFTQSPPTSMLISCKNCLTETSRILSEHISGHRGLAKVTHKISHHIHQASLSFLFLLSFF